MLSSASSWQPRWALSLKRSKATSEPSHGEAAEARPPRPPPPDHHSFAWHRSPEAFASASQKRSHWGDRADFCHPRRPHPQTPTRSRSHQEGCAVDPQYSLWASVASHHGFHIERMTKFMEMRTYDCLLKLKLKLACRAACCELF